MHGFFMDARLYSKAAAAAQPHQYEAWRAAKVAQKMEEERQGRISVARKLPKVCGVSAEGVHAYSCMLTKIRPCVCGGGGGLGGSALHDRG
jgi:hypothetical protein